MEIPAELKFTKGEKDNKLKNKLKLLRFGKSR